MGTGAALASGLVAGLAVAMPLGAIGVLLVQEGALRGVRRALPGAAAVASVDALYCALAVLGGSAAAPVVASWRPWPALVGGGALLVVAGVGLRRGIAARAGGAMSDEVGPSGRATSDEAAASGAARAGGGWRRCLLFVGLTAINPATLVYFAALLSGLAELTGRPTAAGVFVVGVAVASFGWQALLVVGGGLLGGRAGLGARRATVVVGNAMVAALGVATIWRAVRP
ncbi:MAG TPA: LysE family transporter [Propionicimonas sp.]|jgi:arginine exporter protein ArgO